jgi:hypothetical protein
MPEMEKHISTKHAKRLLGYEPSSIVVLTIASPFKYQSPGSVSFLELVEPVLSAHPQAVLIAVGPCSDGAWQKASRNTDGRILPLGTRWDNELLYCAADIYLDSVPFSSITSLLEAGAHGIPLLGLGAPDAERQLLCAGAPGLEGSMLLGEDCNNYQEILSRLITDAQYRMTQGNCAKEQIEGNHTGGNWLAFLNVLYERLEASEGRGCLSDDDVASEWTPLTAALDQLYPPLNINRVLLNHLGHLPFATRLNLSMRLSALGFNLAFLNLLPFSASTLVRSRGRRAKEWCRQLLTTDASARAQVSVKPSTPSTKYDLLR